MKKSSSLVLALSLSAPFILSSCTNPVSTAGSVSSYTTGTITDIEAIDIDTDKYNTSNNTWLGAIGGAILGQIFNNHATGTLVGAGLGAAAGGIGSSIANRQQGLRITLSTTDGDSMIDTHFSCGYEVGQKVRLINNSNGGQLQVYKNGSYHTLTIDDPSTCPTVLSNFTQGVSADPADPVDPDYTVQDIDSDDSTSEQEY